MSTKAIIASTLLTVLFAGQTAPAGQDIDGTIFDTPLTTAESVMIMKINYQAPSADTEYNFEDNIVSGRK